jgi:small subunit ribosomal protein S2
MTDISLKEMAGNAVHFGHPTHKWNPKMKPYLYGSRYGIHIFDLQKTAQHLVKALDFLAGSVHQNKNILFVGTKQQCRKILQEIKEVSNMPIVTDKWIPGLLTNFKTIKKRIDYFKDLKVQDSKGELSKYTKKEQVKLRKKIQDLSISFTGVENMREVPDVLFAADIVRDHIAVEEARRLKIPVVAIVDSNADPDMADYIIPANDDAIKSLTYILNLVKEAVAAKKTEKK